MSVADSSQNKTEAPTRRRREETRKKGNVLRSADLSTSIVILIGMAFLWFSGESFIHSVLGLFRSLLRASGRAVISEASARALAIETGTQLLLLIAPLAALLAVSIVATSIWQSGLQVSFTPLAPELSRLSPSKGLQRVFSSRGVFRGVLLVLKLAGLVCVISWIGASHFRGGAVMHPSVMSAAAAAWHFTCLLVFAFAGVLVLIGLVDFVFQRWRYEQDLKMSRQEVKEEQKNEEGDPHVKTRLRRLQRAAGKRQMLKNVPDAAVVITNPTHIAIALKYERGSMTAPKVVAKGSGILAKRIAKIARQHGVPVLERQPLAWALFKAVDVGQEIPATLYRAVAEILAYLHALRERVRKERR